MTFTYAYLDLPDLPKSFIDAAWRSIDKNKNNHEIKVNNWLDRPGYAEYEYRNFTRRDGSEVKTIKSHRYHVSEEFDQWVQKYLGPDPRSQKYNEWGGVAVYDDHSNFFAPHVDITRDYAIMYILDTGGDQVETSWYRQHGHPLMRPDLKSVFDPERRVNNFDSLEEIDRVCLPAQRWVCINSAIIHAVENVASTRVVIQISRDTPPECKYIQVSEHEN